MRKLKHRNEITGPGYTGSGRAGIQLRWSGFRPFVLNTFTAFKLYSVGLTRSCLRYSFSNNNYPGVHVSFILIMLPVQLSKIFYTCCIGNEQ